MRQLLVLLLVFGGLLAAPGAAHAGSYEDCTGFIDSLPTTISTQGTWCLRGHLSTAITSGNAITINTNNVTIDCHHFKIGGLAAGNGSQTNGIYADSRQNVTIRHCNVRGFYAGIGLVGTGAGHLIEDNRLDNSLHTGIRVMGDNNMVRGNRIYDTGGATGKYYIKGIFAEADIVDNKISGMFATAGGGRLMGIGAVADGSRVSGNTISGLDHVSDQGIGAGLVGISIYGRHVRVSGNHLAAVIETQYISTRGIEYHFSAPDPSALCVGNTVAGFYFQASSCDVSDGNLVLP